MIRSRMALFLGAAFLLTSIVLGGVGCSNKQLSSGSSDQSMTTKDQPQPDSSQHERIQPDRIASVEPPPYSGEAQIQAPTTTTPASSTIAESNSPPAVATQSGDRESVKSPDITKLEDIYFDFDRYNIRADAQPVLERNGQWMRNEQNKPLLIEGHCDERGTLAYNLVLGEKRAKSAKQYLESLGIPAARLHTTSYGEVKPSCREHNEGCWKYNRRAHFVVQ